MKRRSLRLGRIFRALYFKAFFRIFLRSLDDVGGIIWVAFKKKKVQKNGEDTKKMQGLLGVLF